MPGIKNVNESLPPIPLSGMLNKHGGKVRLTFKLEADQLWLSTKERTEKLSMGTIKNVVSEPIEDHEEYHIMVYTFIYYFILQNKKRQMRKMLIFKENEIVF